MRVPIQRIHPGYCRIFVVLLGALIMASCGGKRDVPPDDLDVPNTIPREQVLYREAKETFNAWIGLFNADANYNAGYPLTTWKTRSTLKQAGINDAADFGTWFENRREAGAAPFIYDFSRLDILEIDIKDTNRAVITASFVVTVKDQKFESVGVFYLKRELDKWKVPLAERSDYIRGWWQKEENFDVSVKEAGISTYASNDFNVEFKYPVAWDVSEQTAFKMPYIPEGLRGLELTYQNPSNQQVETVVRIAELPATMVDPQLIADTSIHKLKPIREELATIMSEPHLTGRVYWMYNPARERIIAVFGAVDTTYAAYSSYAESIHDVVRSMTILK